MKKRRGQALIIVVIIIAVVMAVFANSLTTRLRYHSQEETEIYQREQALYLAEMGINQMIFNINNNDDSNISDTAPSGIGNYNATYYTPDNSGFGGSGYIESTGTVKTGTVEEISRKVFASVVSTSDAFKYCLYTKKGKYEKKHNDGSEITFTNKDYGSSYYYNNTSGTVTPYPDWSWYTDSANCPQGTTFVERDYSGKTATYNPFKKNDGGKVVYIHYTGNKASAKLTINFTGENTSSISLLIITDYPKVVFQKAYDEIKKTFGGTQYENIEWDSIYYNSNHQLPVFIHKAPNNNGSVFFDEDDFRDDGLTFTINGLVYSNSPVEFEYGGHHIINKYWGFIDIRGELIAKSLTTDYDYSETQGLFGAVDINGDGRYTTETIFDYDPDGNSNYFLYPPPHFIVPNGLTLVFPGSFREEY